MKAISTSDKILKVTLNDDIDIVARWVERSHKENTSILQYNNENSLEYYAMQNKYIIHRELTTGKGFADLFFIPRKNTELPAIVVELKYNKTSGATIEQIKQKGFYIIQVNYFLLV